MLQVDTLWIKIVSFLFCILSENIVDINSVFTGQLKGEKLVAFREAI
jgi:hypothetical protein